MAVSNEYKVNFFDTDAMAVVHHANYIRWFEIGRVAYLRHYDLTLDDMMADGYVFPITKIDAKYLAPGHFDDVLIIETKATALTKAQMAFAYRIIRKDTGEVLVTGHSQNAFTRKDTGKITRLPDKYFEIFQRAMEDEKAEKIWEE